MKPTRRRHLACSVCTLLTVLVLALVQAGVQASSMMPASLGTSPAASSVARALMQVLDPLDLANKAIHLTNIERAAAGLPPLKENAALSQAARSHSLTMAEGDFFDHTDPVAGSTPGDRARAAGYAWNLVGENIGLGYETATDVVIGWMASPQHRENILKSEFREIGVGFVQGPGPSSGCQNAPCQFYWTQVFGTSEDHFPLIINDEAPATSAPDVGLYIHGQGWADQMRLRNDSEAFTAWEPYSARRGWQLPVSDGLHTVHVELMNGAGESRSASDDILLAQAEVPPSVQTPTAASPRQGTRVPGADGVTLERVSSPQTVITGEEVQVTYLVTGDSSFCGQEVVRVPLDIALVIDQSGSMGAEAGSGLEMTKLQAAQQAARSFLQAIELGTDAVTVVGFHSWAKLVQELDTRADVIGTAIDSLQPTGGTNIADGLLAGLDELSGPRHRQDASSVIILLSDGQGRAGQAAQQAKAAGVRVITIGLGTDVDEAELRRMASSPDDYYFSPDAGQLQTIFTDIARSIREYPAATDLVLTHRFDVTNFDVDEESINPPGELAFDRITWRLPTLGDEVVQLTYRARARVPGDFDLGLGDIFTFRRCAQDADSMTADAGLPVTVQSDPNATPTPIPTPPPRELTPKERTLHLVCGDFPWWLLLPLALFLLLVFLILVTNLFGLRRRWTRHKLHPILCVLGNLLLLAYAFFLLALLLRELKPAICQPREVIYYWEVTPEGESAILYKPITPDLPVREFRPLNRQAECIACHDVALDEDVIAAIADGSNGPVSVMQLDGTPISIPPTTASYLALSPDGQQMAYALEGKDIYILDMEGGTAVPLMGASEPGVIETMPAWSPDGQTVAFVRAQGEVRGYALAVPCDIYTVPSAGGTATLLPGAGGSGFNYYPAYSPDGNWLAFTRHTTGSSTRADPQAEIYLVPAQGGQAQRLAANDLRGGQQLLGASNSWPTWSRDGRYLAFNTKRNGGQFDIYTTTIDPLGKSGPAEPLPDAARVDRFEHLPRWGRPPRVNLLDRLLRLLPWLLGLLLLWLLKRILCRPKPYRHTVWLDRKVTPDRGLVNKQVFNVTLKLIGDSTECDEVRLRKPVDVVLALDISGSMSGPARQGLHERKLDGAKAASRAFIEKMDPAQDRVGLVMFDDQAEVIHSLDAESSALVRAIDSLECRGGTAVHEGLAAALDELQMLGRADTAQAIVLLSDGATAPEPALQQAGSIKKAGIRIITVGFGQDADWDLLQQVATQPKDSHRSASNRQLSEVFVSIAERIQEPLAATDLIFTHRVNLKDFEVVLDSDYPRPHKFEDGVMTWRLAELGDVPVTYRYSLVGRREGDPLNVDQGDVIIYKRCGDMDTELPLPPGLPVTVDGVLPIPKVIKILSPPEPLPVPDRKPVWDPDAVLLVGTGECGRQVLTYLKKNLRDAGAGAIPDRVRFLLVDTAKYLAGGQPLRFAGMALEDDEVMVLDENLRPVLQEMSADPSSHRELQPWLVPQYVYGASPTQNLADGVHGVRPMARAGFVRRVGGKAHSAGPDLVARLERDLEAVMADPHGVRVILVGSLSEGMGAILADLAYLAREIARQKLGPAVPVVIEGYLGFETHRGTNEPVTDAELNALASLRELTWLQLNPSFPCPIRYGNDALDSGLAPLTSRLIDDLYVFVTGLGEEGQRSWPMVADVIAFLLDRPARRVGNRDWFDHRRIDVARAEARERALFFGTGGSFAIRLPAYDIIEQVKVRWAREMIQGFLMGERREKLEFSTQYMDDPGLPGDPAALVDVFLLGFGEGERLHVDAPVPSSVRCLGLVRTARLEDAAQLSDAAQPEAMRAYLAATLELLLMGTDKAGDRQPRAGKIAYAGEFLKALRGRCEGPLRQAISDAAISPGKRDCWEAMRRALLDEVELATQRLDEVKAYLGEVYAALAERERLLAEWRQEMEAIPSRLYVWRELVAPDGAPLAEPEDLSEVWYEDLYQNARPEDYASYLIWDATPNGLVDLRLLLAEDREICSEETSADQFADHLLEFADSHVRALWSGASLAGVDAHAAAKLAHRMGIESGALPLSDLRSVVRQMRLWAQPEALRRDSLQDAPKVERNVLAVCKLLGEQFRALTRAFPAPSVGVDAVQWNWPRLPLSDPLSWQLVHTLDVLSPPVLRRYSSILAKLAREEDRRAVFDWEATAKAAKGRYGNQLLHPVVAAALVDDERAHLYGLAWASGWVRESSGGWSVRTDYGAPALIEWKPTTGWHAGVYGLLHFVYRATEEQVEATRHQLTEHTDSLRDTWLALSQKEPLALRQAGDRDDLHSLRLLSWFAARKRLGELMR